MRPADLSARVLRSPPHQPARQRPSAPPRRSPAERPVDVLVTLRRRRAQALSLGLALAVLATLLTVPNNAARAAKPPPNPSDGQISAAAQHKAALADQVGQL